MSQTTATQRVSEQGAYKSAIHPFQVNVPEAELTELRRRLNAARWPERETVPDHTQGVPLATMEKLAPLRRVGAAAKLTEDVRATFRSLR